jgi:hypothetical protein
MYVLCMYVCMYYVYVCVRARVCVKFAVVTHHKRRGYRRGCWRLFCASTTSTPQYAFMAWCSVKKKHRDNFTYYLIMQSSPASRHFLLGPNILLKSLFSNTFNLCSSLSVEGQVSHPDIKRRNILFTKPIAVVT